jgi:hypothetical protein
MNERLHSAAAVRLCTIVNKVIGACEERPYKTHRFYLLNVFSAERTQPGASRLFDWKGVKRFTQENARFSDTNLLY